MKLARWREKYLLLIWIAWCILLFYREIVSDIVLEKIQEVNIGLLTIVIGVISFSIFGVYALYMSLKTKLMSIKTARVLYSLEMYLVCVLAYTAIRFLVGKEYQIILQIYNAIGIVVALRVFIFVLFKCIEDKAWFESWFSTAYGEGNVDKILNCAVIQVSVCYVVSNYRWDLLSSIIGTVVLLVWMFYSEFRYLQRTIVDTNKISVSQLSHTAEYIEQGVYGRENTDMKEVEVLCLDFTEYLSQKVDKNSLFIESFYKFQCDNSHDISKVCSGRLYVAVDKSKIVDRESFNLSIRYSTVWKGLKLPRRLQYSIVLSKYGNVTYAVKSHIIRDSFVCPYINQTKEITISDKNTVQRLMSKAALDYIYLGDIKGNLEGYIDNESSILFQNGRYGTGKTTYAIKSICQNGYSPVVLSPWEDNTSFDFIYAIFIALKKRTRKGAHSLAKEFEWLYWSLYLSTLILLGDVFSLWGDIISREKWKVTIKLFTDYIGKEVSWTELLNSNVALVVLAVLLAIIPRFIFFPHIVHKLVVYKEKFNDYYKEPMLKDIAKMLENGPNLNNILLIEDLDRLKTDEVEKVLRELAFLNKKYTKIKNKNSIVAIVSYDKEKMIENCRGKMCYYDYHKKIYAGSFTGENFDFSFLTEYKQNTILKLKKFTVMI